MARSSSVEGGILKSLGVIPARYASTRFPGKPLAQIQGKPMLQWVVEAAQKCKELDQLVVATDDERIFKLCEKISVEAKMTPSELPSGSDRAWNVASQWDLSDDDVIVNIQGDEPLLDPQVISQLLKPFEQSSPPEMATLARPCTAEDLNNLSAAKVVLNHKSEAIYFSRYAIPFSRQLPKNYQFEDRLIKSQKPKETQNDSEVFPGVLCHIGLYAYRKNFLQTYCQAGVCEVERAEGLEQLRALYLGARLAVVKVAESSCGVDTPEDIEKVERLLEQRNI